MGNTGLIDLLIENGLRVNAVRSGIVNFSNSGLGSTMLASLFPNFGRSLIVRAVACSNARIADKNVQL